MIDLDRHGNGSDGVSAFKELIARHGALPPGVPTVKTPNNGFHLYFRQPPGEPLGNGRGNLPDWLRRARRRRIRDRVRAPCCRTAAAGFA